LTGFFRPLNDISKVRALTRIATPANEQDLLSFGRAGTAAHVEKLVRGMRLVDRLAAGDRERCRHAARYLRAYTDEDGMVVVTARLAPETGARCCAPWTPASRRSTGHAAASRLPPHRR
jgi:hypothetical protein